MTQAHPDESRSESNLLARRAFTILAGALCAHALLQTGRDALFLARIPATQLPWVYLMVAGLTLLVAQGHKRFKLRGLGSTLFGASIGTVILWGAVPLFGVPAIYALYAWTGAIGAWTSIQFWGRVSDTMTMTDARRLFAGIATGATLGAVAGNLAGTALMAFLPAIALLPSAAVVYLLTSVAARRLDRSFLDAERKTVRAMDAPTAREIWTPYVISVAIVVLLGSMALTTVDWYFKAEMARRFDPADLGQAFAVAYLVLNVVGALVQVFIVQRVLRGPGVMAGLAVLPTLIATSATLGILGLPTVAAAMAKLSDGALKYTLNKTAAELLYVPMSGRVRRRVKDLIDVIGRKGGQAAASLLILAFLALGLDVIYAFVGLAVLWLGSVMALRRPYREVFRTTLRGLVVDMRGELPALDVHSLSTLVEGLSSTDDAQVLASLTLLQHHDKTNLVPTLLLYHPSAPIVERALDHLSRAGHERVVPVARRILGSTTPRVHAAAVRALYRFDLDAEFLLDHLDNFCIATRATSVVFAEGRGLIEHADFEARVQTFFDADNPAGREALARAAEFVTTPNSRELLHRLLVLDDPEIRALALGSLAQKNDLGDAEFYLDVLGDRSVRELSRAALEGLGAAAAPLLIEALTAPRWTAIRWQVPDVIARLPPNVAIPALAEALTNAADGLVEYHLIRALEWTRSHHPQFPVPVGPLHSAFVAAMENVNSMVQARACIDAIEGDDPGQRRRMLATLLEKKRNHAAERALRLRSLSAPRENIHLVLRGLLGPHPVARASALELLDGWVPAPHRVTLRAHFAGRSAEGVCRDAGLPVPTDVAQVYGDLAASRSTHLRLLAQSLQEAP